MKRIVITALLLALVMTGALADEILRLTFNDGSIGGEADARNYIAGTYAPGPDATITQVDTMLVRFFDALRRGGDPPRLAATDEVLAGAPQGGQAFEVHSGRKAQGLQIVLSEPFEPGDLTLEFVFMADVLEPEGNSFGFMYLASNEWPNGGRFMWAFRRASDQPFNFVVFGDASSPEEIRLPVQNPIEAERWYHAAGVLDYNESEPAESMVRFYVNGELQAEASYDASGDEWSLGSSNNRYAQSFSIGYSNGQDANPYDSRGMSGAVDAFSASNDALTPESFRLPLP